MTCHIEVPVGGQDTVVPAVLARIQQVAAAFADRLGALPRPPAEAEMEFGIAVSAEAGVKVAPSREEGSFTVRLTWRTGATPAPDPVLAELERWFLTGDGG